LLPGVYRADLRVSYDVDGHGARALVIPITHTVKAGVSLSLDVVTANVFAGADPSAVPVAINYTGSGDLSWSASVDSMSGRGWVSVAPDGGASLPDRFDVDLAPASMGSYFADVVVEYGFGGLTRTLRLPVAYHVVDVVDELRFVLNASTGPEDMEQTVTLGGGAAAGALGWTASADEPWLSLSPTGGDSAGANRLTVALVRSEVANLTRGEHTATITLTSTGPDAATTQIAVNLTLDLPVVRYVAPYVAYTNSVGTDYVIVRGRGFSGLAQDVLFGSEAASDVDVVSDTELRVVPPVLAEGAYRVDIDNPLGLQLSEAELLVKAPPAFKSYDLTTSLGYGNGRVIYDAEREAVYVVRCYICSYSASNLETIVKYSYNRATSSWEYQRIDFPFIQDMALSPDGREMIVVTREQLFRVDPETFATIRYVNLPRMLDGIYTGQVAMLNHGVAVIRSLGQTYDLRTGEFKSVSPLGDSIIDGTIDGSRAFVGDSANTSVVGHPIRYYDASTDTIVTSRASYWYSGHGKADLHGNRFFMDGRVLDRDLNLLGSISAMSTFSAMAPDGSTLYAYASSPDSLQVIDLTGPPPYTPHARITLREPGPTVISQDGGTLFVVGATYFMVRPVASATPMN
jgi:hypothetical protein